MPFTPAHPAIILPWIRSRYLSATGLIVGSMSPDFEYFFKMTVQGAHGHTIPGLLYFDLPVSILVGLLFHTLVKKNLIHNLPLFFQVRLQPLMQFDFMKCLRQRSVVVGVSSVMGAASHIFWDSFTHNNAYFVRTLSFYKGTHIPFQGVNYPLFYALQHISTVVGLLVVFIYLLRMRPDSQATLSLPNILYWLLVVLIAANVAMLRFVIRPDDYELGNLVVSCISGFLVAVICAGFINFNNKIIEG